MFSDMSKACISIEIEKGNTPRASEDSGSNVDEAVSNELSCLPQISANDEECDEYLPLASLEIARVQVADLQQREELLARRAVIAVGSRDHCRNLQGCQGLAGLLAAVIGAAVEQKDRVLAPIRVLGVEAASQPEKECAEEPRLVALLADGEV